MVSVLFVLSLIRLQQHDHMQIDQDQNKEWQKPFADYAKPEHNDRAIEGVLQDQWTLVQLVLGKWIGTLVQMVDEHLEKRTTAGAQPKNEGSDHYFVTITTEKHRQLHQRLVQSEGNFSINRQIYPWPW